MVLTKEQRRTEKVKCVMDPLYYLNTYGHVFDAKEKKVMPMKCFEYQKTCIRGFHDFQNNIVLKSRQTGLSVITAGYVAWRLMFRYEEKILIIANDGAGARRFLATVKQFIDNTPAWLRPEDTPTNNQSKLEFSNKSWVEAKASSPNAGRGESLTMLVLDETAFIKDDAAIWMGAGMALSATKGKCIMISTPNGASGLYHETWLGAINRKNDFNNLSVHWTQNPQCSEGIVFRKDPITQKESPWSPWYEEQCQRLSYDTVKIAQELDLSFEGSKYLAIDGEIIQRYANMVRNEKPVDFIKYDWLYKGTQNAGSFVTNETNFHVFKRPEVGKSYIVACLPPGEKVLTHNGLKNIEDVTFEDKLMDKDGFEVEIKNIQITRNVDDHVYSIRPSNTFRKTKFTSNHPILACNDYNLKRNYNPNHDIYSFNERFWDLDYKFINASELKPGDWLIYPNIYFNKDKDLDFIKEKFKVHGTGLREDFRIDENIALDEEFWWFVGLWLAEGWVENYSKSDYSIVTSHNLNTEIELVERITTLFKKYDRDVFAIPCIEDNSIKAQFNCKQIATFLTENFGKYADGKYINEWVKYLPEKFKIKLVEGYLNGDGSWFKDTRRGNSTISFVSVSLNLLEDFQDILFSLGVISSLALLRNEKVTKIKDRVVHQKKTYQLSTCHYDSLLLAEKMGYTHDFKVKNKRIIKDCFLSKDRQFIHFRIKDIEKENYQGDVYNFETETHTFLCKNITTHNCDVARGDGKDYSTIQVLDVETLEQVAEYREKIGADLFPYLIDWVGRVYNNAFVVVEANSFGLGVGYDLRDKLQYKRLFYSKNTQEMHVRPYDYKIDLGVEIPGFQSTKTSRPAVVKSIVEHLREGGIIIHSQRLVGEMSTFIMNGDRPEAEKGYNDDLLMAYGIGLYVRDTEYGNVSATVNMHKAMLDAMTFSTSSSSGFMKPEDDGKPKKDIDVPTGGGGLFFGNGDSNDDDDLSWLTK